MPLAFDFAFLFLGVGAASAWLRKAVCSCPTRNLPLRSASCPRGHCPWILRLRGYKGDPQVDKASAAQALLMLWVFTSDWGLLSDDLLHASRSTKRHPVGHTERNKSRGNSSQMRLSCDETRDVKLPPRSRRRCQRCLRGFASTS